MADQTTLVTGASTGIGREAALELAKRGSDIAVLARRKDRLTDFCRRYASQTGLSSSSPATLANTRDLVPPIYAATKWWTQSFAFSLAGQVGGNGVGVTVINPTEVWTEFGKEFRDAVSEDRFEPDKVTDPTTIASAIAFAAEQELPGVVAELGLYRRDKLSSL